jgi:hypothetical protein
VPHVTIAPIARGMGVKPAGQRYFGRYIHAWVPDAPRPGVHHCGLGERTHPDRDDERSGRAAAVASSCSSTSSNSVE